METVIEREFLKTSARILIRTLRNLCIILAFSGVPKGRAFLRNSHASIFSLLFFHVRFCIQDMEQAGPGAETQMQRSLVAKLLTATGH